MCSFKRYLLLALTALSLVNVGCSTSRQHLALRDSRPPRISPANDTIASTEARDVPEVQTVAFRDDETVEGTEESADSAIQLAVPVEVGGFAMDESGLTLEDIEQLLSI